MLVSHFGGDVIVSSESELAGILEQRYGDGVNEFWMSRGDEPSLALLVNRDRGCLHFFPDATHPGWQSLGERDDDELVRFSANSPAEAQEMPMYTTVPIELALRAARDFFHAKRMSACIRWAEL